MTLPNSTRRLAAPMRVWLIRHTAAAFAVGYLAGAAMVLVVVFAS